MIEKVKNFIEKPLNYYGNLKDFFKKQSNYYGFGRGATLKCDTVADFFKM